MHLLGQVDPVPFGVVLEHAEFVEFQQLFRTDPVVDSRDHVVRCRGWIRLATTPGDDVGDDVRHRRATAVFLEGIQDRTAFPVREDVVHRLDLGCVRWVTVTCGVR